MQTIGQWILILTVGAVATGCSGGAGSGNPADREKRALALVDHAASGRFAEARADFNMVMAIGLSKTKFETVWKGLEDQVGKFRKRTWVKQGEDRGYNIVRVGLEFEKATMAARVVFDSGDDVTGLFFKPWAPDWKAPDYPKQTGFTEAEIEFGHPDWRLSGTLTVPEGIPNPPVVILVHGSGPQDRDQTIGGNRPFKDIAWGLGWQGVAVLRYEKRTKSHPGKLAQQKHFTMRQETVEDAVFAYEFLRQRQDVDPKSIYLLGHSQGGYCAPRIARQTEGLAGFISLAGNSRPLEELILEQTEYLANINPKQAPDLKGMRLAAEQVKRLTPADARKRGVLLGAPMSYWFDLQNYDPIETAKEFNGRILILHGGRDYQVSEKDFSRWTNGLAKQPDLESKTFPSLNHLMMSGTGKSTPAEYQQVGHVQSVVVAEIARWVKDGNN